MYIRTRYTFTLIRYNIRTRIPSSIEQISVRKIVRIEIRLFRVDDTYGKHDFPRFIRETLAFLVRVKNVLTKRPANARFVVFSLSIDVGAASVYSLRNDLSETTRKHFVHVTSTVRARKTHPPAARKTSIRVSERTTRARRTRSRLGTKSTRPPDCRGRPGGRRVGGPGVILWWPRLESLRPFRRSGFHVSTGRPDAPRRTALTR